MRQTLHIFAKDTRHFWPEIVVSIALVAVFVWTDPIRWLSQNGLYAVAGRGIFPALLQERFLTGLVPLLIPLTWWLLIARVIHAETLVGDRQFWVTRPYEWKSLLGAKLLFLAVFLYAPIFTAQCLLLVRVGFDPASHLPGLFFNLFLISAILVLPLAAIAAVTSSFPKMTLILLTLLITLVGYVAIGLLFYADNVSLPFNGLSIPLILFFCGGAVTLQYARRKTRISRLLLMALPALMVISSLATSGASPVDRDYPRPGDHEQAPIRLSLFRDRPNPPQAYVDRSRQVELTIPLEESGVAEGYALLANNTKVIVRAADGSHWTSSWQPVGNQNYLPGDSESYLRVSVDRAFYDRARSRPVQLNFTIAFTEVKAASATTLSLPARAFSVFNFGICSPQLDWFGRQFSGIACRFPLRQPKLTYVGVQWADGPCSGPEAAVPGGAWVGNLDDSPADFGISSVWSEPLSFSNSSKQEGGKFEPRRLCPGTPISFTRYNFKGRTQYDFSIEDFRLPAYEVVNSSPGAVSFDITAQ